MIDIYTSAVCAGLRSCAPTLRLSTRGVFARVAAGLTLLSCVLVHLP